MEVYWFDELSSFSAAGSVTVYEASEAPMEELLFSNSSADNHAWKYPGGGSAKVYWIEIKVTSKIYFDILSPKDWTSADETTQDS